MNSSPDATNPVQVPMKYICHSYEETAVLYEFLLAPMKMRMGLVFKHINEPIEFTDIILKERYQRYADIIAEFCYNNNSMYRLVELFVNDDQDIISWLFDDFKFRPKKRSSSVVSALTDCIELWFDDIFDKAEWERVSTDVNEMGKRTAQIDESIGNEMFRKILINLRKYNLIQKHDFDKDVDYSPNNEDDGECRYTYRFIKVWKEVFADESP